MGIEAKVARIRAGMKQEDVAALLGVSQPQVSRWERGEIEPPEDAVKKITEHSENVTERG